MPTGTITYSELIIYSDTVTYTAIITDSDTITDVVHKIQSVV